MEKRTRLWSVLLLVLILFGGLFAWLWPSCKIYLAPKTVLSTAIADTYDALVQRMEYSPAVLIAGVLDTDNGNSVDLTLDTKNQLLGSIRYDMDVQIQWNPKRILAQGQAQFQRKAMDLSVYLDEDFAALSSTSILQGKYYGLTYDSFSDDIRSSPILAMMIGESTLRQWESGVKTLRSQMGTPLELPNISQEDLRSILMGILALSAEVEREEEYFVITFETTGAQIAAGLELMHTDLPVSFKPSEEVEFSFWLKNDHLIRIQVDAEDLELDLYTGTNAATDDLTLRWEADDKVTTVAVSTQSSETASQETISIQGDDAMVISYLWDHSTGELGMDISQSGRNSHLQMNLTQTDAGFRLETQDFESLMHPLLGTKDSGDSPCTLIVTKGADFETPVYKNFINWTLDDLATLLGGVGGLFGLQAK